jgi:hypothetical protein
MQAVRRRGARAALAAAAALLPLAAIGPPGAAQAASSTRTDNTARTASTANTVRTASTARAASAGAGVGCTGATCSVSLASLVTLRGDAGATGSTQTPLNVPQPPCRWQPIGDTATGARYIIRNYGGIPPGAPFGVFQALQTAKQQLRRTPVPPGTWYLLPTNPAATPAGQRACQALPLFFFAVPGQAPPAPPIPPGTLAAYAYDRMTIPAPRLTVNPAARGYVNLASYVWGQTRPVSAATGRPDRYEVIATLGGTTVSVWAQLARTGAFSVTVASGHGSAYSACGPDGSRFPVGQVPVGADAAGRPPDCGVLWQAPAPAAGVSATAHWTVSWGRGVLAGPGPNRMPPIMLTGRSRPFPVAEIQSINGG